MNELALEISNVEVSGSGKKVNPFPGLRPFSTEESHLFFGREGQSEDILTALSATRFVAVMGSSGSGKSSLIYCGVIPILQGGFITNAGSSWKVISFNPGDQPIISLSKAIAHSLYKEANSEMNETVTEIILRRSSQGLIEAIRQSDLKAGENVLLVVDQFEELFRFTRNEQNNSSLNEAGAFVKLIVESVRQQRIPVYVVLTMRSDFIGDCAQFQELTKLINESNYLIPQMTRDDFRNAIEGPIAVCGAKIEPHVTEQLLNDLGDTPDQLPVLQHALMRTWEYWLLHNDAKRPIGLSDYEAIGKMQKALSEHANEAFNELTEEGKKICERMFKTLTEKGSDNRGIRRPTRVEEIAEIAWASIDQVIEVVEKFRLPGRSFLTPSIGTPINKDTVIDLSHESLMRIWTKLGVWVEEEAISIRMYKRLAEDAALYQSSKTGLLKPPELLLALNWEKEQKPVFTWAKRYNPAFERTKVFLRLSEKAYEAEEFDKIKLQVRKLRRTRLLAVLLGSAAIVALLAMLYIQSLRISAEKSENRAVTEKKIADEQRILAQNNSKEAQTQKEIALKLKAVADAQTVVAENQKIVALKNADSAVHQTIIANYKTKESKEQQALAEKNAKEAMLRGQEAEKAREEAYTRRMLTVARAMAIKSLDIVDDRDLKGLLAYQAYLFNHKYGGHVNNVDIFSGLYGAMQLINSKFSGVYQGHTDAVNSLAFVPNSSVFFSAGSDGRILKWNLDDVTNTPLPVINTKIINRVLAISNNGKWLACGTSGQGIAFFDLKMGNWTARYCRGSSTNISALTFMPDNKHLVAAGEDNKVYIWDLEKGTFKDLAMTQSLVVSLSASPDGNLIAGGTKDGKVILWETSDYSRTVLFDEPKNSVPAVAFSHNGKMLATGDLQGNIRYWNVTKRSLITKLHGHSARISDLKFSPDDELLASASFDATVQLWTTNDLISPPIKFRNHDSWVLSVAFNPAGDRIISGSLSGNRLVADPTKSRNIADLMCSKLKRNMTQNEWNTYVGSDIPYEKTCGK